ncbi:sensor histidine kinase [Actinocrispum wychmicini]|uniref:histidine kinase n=1 Tax=Actinocrispum wychmicini TaxID=1213861 RepID=A0A4R2K7P3_9PSEU|nr:HAMP domain-containing sensor histidine kinase [Actinocrispum wychmicini]TCO65848.1 signal transduction histidine kinase [Actinocrispum wychmicini]
MRPLSTWWHRPRLTIRMRLTLTYGSMVLLGGTLLIGGAVALVDKDLFAPLPPSLLPQKKLALADLIVPAEVLVQVLVKYRQLAPVITWFINTRNGSTTAIETQLRERLRDEAISRLVESSGVLLGGLALFSVAAGWWIAGRVVRRLKRVTEAARRASETTLHERLNLPGPPDELTELGDTFDAMLERLDTAFDAQRRFVANASHELRTPLSVTRAVVDVTLAKADPTVDQLRAMGVEVQRATIRAERLIAGLLALARSESAVQQVGSDDLADLAMEALDAVRGEIRRNGLTVTTELAPAPVHGDIALLSRAVANLVENAVRHNVSAGRVHVLTRASTSPSDHGVVLEVSNTGPVVPPADIDRLFEPFYRADRSRLHSEGFGLGLSIVRAVAASHRATVRTRPRPGGGLTVTLCFGGWR